MTIQSEKANYGFSFVFGFFYGPSRYWPLENHFGLRLSFFKRHWTLEFKPTKKELNRSHALRSHA